MFHLTAGGPPARRLLRPDDDIGDLPMPGGVGEGDLPARRAGALSEHAATAAVMLDVSGIDTFAMPIDEAFARNSCSTDSIAVADSQQTVIVDLHEREPNATTAGG